MTGIRTNPAGMHPHRPVIEEPYRPVLRLAFADAFDFHHGWVLKCRNINVGIRERWIAGLAPFVIVFVSDDIRTKHSSILRILPRPVIAVSKFQNRSFSKSYQSTSGTRLYREEAGFLGGAKSYLYPPVTITMPSRYGFAKFRADI